MKHAIGITQHHDVENPPMYVRYSNEAVVNTKAVDPEEAVLIDLDAAGDVIGIELVCVDDYTIGRAREMAESCGLVLPPHLEGVFA